MPATDYNPIVAARRVYDQEPCARTFEADLEAHLLHGWVFSTPAAFLMGRPVRHDAPPGQILDSWHVFGPDADCWHVWLAAGDLAGILGHVPFSLPWVSFERDNRLRLYRFESLLNRIQP